MLEREDTGFNTGEVTIYFEIARLIAMVGRKESYAHVPLSLRFLTTMSDYFVRMPMSSNTCSKGFVNFLKVGKNTRMLAPLFLSLS